MTDSGTPQDSGIQEISAHNQQALEELAWAIEMAQGDFTLILARCSYASLRDRMVEQLQHVCSVAFQVMVLSPSVTALYAAIRDEIGETQPDALMVFGLETVSDLEQLLTLTNQVREEFRKNLPFPLVLWVTDEVHGRLVRSAPDFESWATTTEFAIATPDLLASLHQAADNLFTALLSPDTVLSFRKIVARLELTILRRQELEAALRDLQSRGQALDTDLQASLCFFRGVNAGVSYEAVEHLEKSLKLWQQVAAPAPDTAPNTGAELSTQLKLGLSLFFLGQCQYYLDGQDKQRSPDLSDTKRLLQQAVAIFEQANRPDLVAKCVGQLKRTLERLSAWDELAAVAQQSLSLHQTYSDSSRLAQDYRYLAEAALQHQQGAEAKQLAQQALEHLATDPDNQRWRGLYLLTLAKAERLLGNEGEAIAQLKAAYDLGDQGVPRLFVQVLEELRDIYLTQKQYLEAFQLKLTRLSVEQQYGIRAFVGAGRLRPKREDAEKLIEQRNPTPTVDEIAPEIRSSGRQKDLEQLLQRIGDTEHRLIVVCGYSGVGKSSLVVAGLVPALKQRAIGFRNNVPVLVRTYSDWVEEVGRQLGISSLTPDQPTLAILERLRQNEQRNLRTILIFDQFEEFFFVYPDPLQRRQFFEFLGQCLQVLSVKVILSLREDYLHYLLEGSRIASIQSTGIDILSQNVLYSLGNFSPANATAIIQDLTERAQFYLEADLVDALVQDLAGELGEVRPIELQVVGAQLQDEGITRLAQYRACGDSPKAELVKRYLAQSVADCGTENQQIAELVLYLLTDEKGTRPLKTRPELERDLQAIAVDSTQLTESLDLVLCVLVGSGLVVLLPEIPTDRYQLVHDYIAAFIRQQQGSQLDRLIAELEAERQQRRLNEAELVKEKQAKQILEEANQEAQQTNHKANQRLKLASGFLLFAVVAGGVASGVAVWANRQLNEAQEVIRLERAGVQAQQQFEFDQLASLVSAVQAGEDLKALMHHKDTGVYPAASPVLALQTISDTIQEQTHFRGHQGEVNSVAFSPDGKQIVTAGDDGTARLWSLDGKEVQQFGGHQGWVYSASFSPDGKQIVTAGNDGTVRLWSLDGKEVQQFKGHQGEVNSASFSPDGKQIVTAGDDGTARLWSLDGKEVQQFKGHQGLVRSVNFSPNGKQIVTTGEDGTARLWSLDGTEVQQFKGHQGWVRSVNFSPDGKQIVTAGDDGTTRLWSLDGKEVQQFKGHQGWVSSVNFSPDGKQIVTVGEDGTARLWSLDGNEVQQFKGHQGVGWSVAFSPNGKQIVTAGKDSTTRLWSLDGKEVQQFKGHQGWVMSVAFSPVRAASPQESGQQIVTAGEDGTARLWSLDGKEVQQFKGHQGLVRSVNFSPDGKQIITAGDDGTARLWSLDGKEVQQFKGHQGWVMSVNFSPNGKQIVTAGNDGTARLWSLDGKEVQQFKGHQGLVRSVNFSPNGKQIVTTGEDGTARLWSLDGKEVQQFKGHQGLVRSVNFSPVRAASPQESGQQIITAGEDGTARLWSLNGTEVQQFKGHRGVVLSVAFSPDGQQIVTTGNDGTARLWSLDGKEVQQFKGHQGWVSSVNFSPDGKQIVTAGDDGTAKLFPVYTLTQLLEQGCTHLNNFLIAYPKQLQTLTTCQNDPKRLAAAALNLVTEAEDEARSGSVDVATNDFRTALSWNSNLNIDIETRLNQLVIEGKVQRLVLEGESLAGTGEIQEAITAYNQAIQLDPSVDISADSWNSLCWAGSLHQQAKAVMFACEKAVVLALQDGSIRDSRGLARALAGDRQGAIADFQFFVDWTSETEKKAQRQKWIRALQAGQNPFTIEELQKLLNLEFRLTRK